MLPALASLFDSPHSQRLEIKGGEPLYSAGAEAKAVFLVRSGGLTVLRGTGSASMSVGVVRPGEIVGESALLAGTTRTATVIALRDSEIAMLPSERFFAALATLPEAMNELARLLIARTQTGDPDSLRTQPKILAVMAACATVHAETWADRLARSIETLGMRVACVHASDQPLSPADWSMLEAGHDIVLCAVEHDDPAWAALCQRQVDRFLLLACPTQACQNDASGLIAQSHRKSGLVDLALIGPATANAASWLDATEPSRLFRCADEDQSIARIARVLTGKAVGVVLSGGGARAFAHVGAVRALRRANIPIDVICGTSMGAIVGAGVAAGWSDGELDMRLRRAFVETSPLDDIALPFVAMTRGRKVERRLREHFGETDISDLRLPYFCVSTDLNVGEDVVHRRGCLTTALRASISLPGILPPVIAGDRVLVDGGVLRNLPSELLRAEHHGTIIGVDVSQAKGLMAADVARPSPLLQWFWSGKWRRGPPIVSLLMRAATVGAGPDLARSRAACDLYVMPAVEMIEIRNWRAYDRAVEAGEAAMTEALAQLSSPVTELRQRRLTEARNMPI